MWRCELLTTAARTGSGFLGRVLAFFVARFSRELPPQPKQTGLGKPQSIAFQAFLDPR